MDSSISNVIIITITKYKGNCTFQINYIAIFVFGGLKVLLFSILCILIIQLRSSHGQGLWCTVLTSGHNQSSSICTLPQSLQNCSKNYQNNGYDRDKHGCWLVSSVLIVFWTLLYTLWQHADRTWLIVTGNENCTL
jgi:hypothetical protein